MHSCNSRAWTPRHQAASLRSPRRPDEGEVAYGVSIERLHVHLGRLEDSHEPGLLMVQGLEVRWMPGRWTSGRISGGL